VFFTFARVFGLEVFDVGVPSFGYVSEGVRFGLGGLKLRLALF
jgi:hypothetical protein